MKRALVFLIAVCGCSSESSGPELGSGSFSMVAVGDVHSCAAVTGGSAFCFGSDETAQLGDRAVGSRATPARVETAATFVAISAGAQHTCAIDSNSQAYCWGNNNYGQLGNNTTYTIDVPLVLPTGLRFTSVSSGSLHSCALTSAGDAYCWGAGGQGQLGNGAFKTSLGPVHVASSVRFSTIEAGGFHTCALAQDGQAYCWGENNYGQLGIGSLDNSAVPVLVSGGLTYTSISAGHTHTCAIAADAHAWCWGSSLFGELGTTLLQVSGPGWLGPSAVFGGHSFSSISAGAGFTCAVMISGAGWCWGRGLEGQIGNGHAQNSSTPQLVTQGQFSAPFSFTSISAGRTHACGISPAGSLYCWGSGDKGQLGSSATAFSPVALRVATQ